ncbi:MAG: hypothetical protein IJM37_00250 [Lachnospiraceae bacterium]|nr:hypothetical protein [Lachnospiraceae bacterium]
MNLFKNNLDERQEQTLLKIEHNACWFAFWALLSSLFIQQFIFGFDLKNIIGEWIVFMCMAVYLVGASMKNNIWDRHLNANPKTNIIVSLVAAAATGIIMFAVVFRNYPDAIFGAAAGGLISALMVFVLCFAALSVLAHSYNKKRDELEKEPAEEDEI